MRKCHLDCKKADEKASPRPMGGRQYSEDLSFLSFSVWFSSGMHGTMRLVKFKYYVPVHSTSDGITAADLPLKSVLYRFVFKT